MQSGSHLRRRYVLITAFMSCVELRATLYNASPRRPGFSAKVEVEAHVVTIRNAALPDDRGILNPLLEKWQDGHVIFHHVIFFWCCILQPSHAVHIVMAVALPHA